MRRSYNHNKPTTTRPLHGATRFLPLAATALLVAAAALGAIALGSTSYLTTTQLAPFFDDVASASSSRTETRVGAFEICYQVIEPTPSPSERCFSYHRASAVMGSINDDIAFYASACAMATRAWRRERPALHATLAETLGEVCSAEGATARGLAVVSLIAAFCGCLTLLDSLSSTNPNVRMRFCIALVCSVLGACCALTTYLSWTTVIRANRHVMQQGSSALLTLTSAGAFLGAAVAIYMSHRFTSVYPQDEPGQRSTAVIL